MPAIVGGKGRPVRDRLVERAYFERRSSGVRKPMPANQPAVDFASVDILEEVGGRQPAMRLEVTRGRRTGGRYLNARNWLGPRVRASNRESLLASMREEARRRQAEILREGLRPAEAPLPEEEGVPGCGAPIRHADQWWLRGTSPWAVWAPVDGTVVILRQGKALLAEITVEPAMFLFVEEVPERSACSGCGAREWLLVRPGAGAAKWRWVRAHEVWRPLLMELPEFQIAPGRAEPGEARMAGLLHLHERERWILWQDRAGKTRFWERIWGNHELGPRAIDADGRLRRVGRTGRLLDDGDLGRGGLGDALDAQLPRVLHAARRARHSAAVHAL